MADRETGFWGAVARAQSVGGAAAALSLIIIGTLCLDYWQTKAQGDQTILASTLSVVLGYYFGTKKPKGGITGKADQANRDRPG